MTSAAWEAHSLHNLLLTTRVSFRSGGGCHDLPRYLGQSVDVSNTEAVRASGYGCIHPVASKKLTISSKGRYRTLWADSDPMPVSWTNKCALCPTLCGQTAWDERNAPVHVRLLSAAWRSDGSHAARRTKAAAFSGQHDSLRERGLIVAPTSGLVGR